MVMDQNIDFAVRFPFTQTAKELLVSKGIVVSNRLADLAVERILGTLTGSGRKSTLVHEGEKLEEIASYAAARMMLGFMKNTYLINKYAIAEAKRASHYIGKASQAEFDRIAQELGIVAQGSGDKLRVSLPVYLKNSPRSIDYRLVNRNVDSGWVPINHHEWARLLEEAVKIHVEHVPYLKEAPLEIKEAAKRLMKKLPKPKTIELGTGNWKQETGIQDSGRETRDAHGSTGPETQDQLIHPQCIEALLEDVRQHKNLAHQARWFLAVYLIKKGASDDDLNALFSLLPDYVEKITRYQIAHARKQNYSIPTCASVLSYGLCRAHCGIKNPGQYRGLRKDESKKKIVEGTETK